MLGQRGDTLPRRLYPSIACLSGPHIAPKLRLYKAGPLPQGETDSVM